MSTQVKRKRVWRKSKPVPPIQVMARMVGNFQWVCPHCGYIHGSDRAKWRTASITCYNGPCMHTFRTGIGFTSQLGGILPPYNAVYAGVFDNYNANALEIMPNGTLAVGRIVGRVDWVCPDCLTPQCTSTDWDLCSTVCLKCAKVWYLRLILWRPVQRFPVATPYDWTPIVRNFGNMKTVKLNNKEIPIVSVDQNAEQTTTIPIPAAPVDQIPGEHRP